MIFICMNCILIPNAFSSIYQKYYTVKLTISDHQILTIAWLKIKYNVIYNIQGLQHSGKIWKIREKFGKMEKSGKTWKTQRNLLENHSAQGNLRWKFEASVQHVDTITLCGS